MRKPPPFVFVKGAPPGYRKLKNRRTGKIKLIRMKGGRVRRVKRGGNNPTRKITELVEVDGGPSQWRVTFKTEDGGLFELSGVQQLNKPELHHIQMQADTHADWFWNYGAKEIGRAVPGRYELKRSKRGGNNPTPSMPGRYVRRLRASRERAMRQARLLGARKHGFKPTGRPARSVVKRAQALRRGAGNMTLFAISTGRRRRITLRTRPVGGKVIARNLTLGQLKQRAREHHFKLRSL